MRCTLALLSLLLVRPAFGQQYFEGLFGGEESGNGIASGGTVLVESGYLTLSYKLVNGVSRPFIFSIDSEGQQTDSLSLAQADTVYRMSLNLLDMGDQSYVGLSSWRNLNQESAIWGDGHLFRFDAHGQVEWESTLGDPNRREIPQRVVSTTDGGFAIAGQVIHGVSPNANGDAYLIRTDALGNALWEQTYGGTLYDAASDLIQTPDGGFFLLGWTRSYGAGQRDFYLIKTDSMGNQQWQRVYGGGGSESGANIISLSNGNYLLSGGGQMTGSHPAASIMRSLLREMSFGMRSMRQARHPRATFSIPSNCLTAASFRAALPRTREQAATQDGYSRPQPQASCCGSVCLTRTSTPTSSTPCSPQRMGVFCWVGRL
jgi:hypothetical protein